MAAFRNDYILRLIESIGIVIAKVVGLRVKGQFEEALQEIETATALLPGPPTEMLSMVDSSTAAGLLQQPAYIAAYARLLAEKARIQRQMGDHGAESNEKRALELALEAHKIENSPSEELCELVDRLVDAGAENDLAGSYLDILSRS